MLYQEFRPYRFDDMVGQNYIVENIRAQAKRDAWFHSFILAGQFGSGKTTMARIIAMATNCRHKDENGNPCCECPSCQAILGGNAFDFREIDGASNTGVDNIRDLKEYVSFRPVAFDKKVIIIDEVHKLSNAAFNSLLKVLEEPPEYTIFILCTTEVEAIPDTVQSRCAVYRFGAIPEPMIAKHLLNIAHTEGFLLDEDAALLIAKYSSGAMRNAIKYLEQLSASSERITADFVSLILGVADSKMLFDLITIYMEQRVDLLPAYVAELQSSGRDMVSFFKEVERACADLIICKESDPNLLAGTESYRERAVALSKEYSTSAICQLSSELVTVSAAMRLDGTATSFLVQSVALINRLRASIMEREGVLKDVNRLSNELAGLKAELLSLIKNGIPQGMGVVSGVPDALSEEPGVSKECERPEEEQDDAVCSTQSSYKGLEPDEDGFTSSYGTEVPFDESSDTGAESVEEEEERESDSMSYDEDEEDEDDDDIMDLMAMAMSEEPVAAPIRVKPIAPVSPYRNQAGDGERPSAEPIPRGSFKAAAPAASVEPVVREPEKTVSRADVIKEQLLSAAKGTTDIYEFLLNECTYHDRGDHLMVAGKPFWKVSALQNFLKDKKLDRLVETEFRQ